MIPSPAHRLNPKKLLLSKWTAVSPRHREMHFLVSKVHEPAPPSTSIEKIELEAVHSGRAFTLPWRELENRSQWLQGWKSLTAKQ
ncbi:MAG TPA: TIGR02450 family Trp-rich protein [Xanthomonadales bacterium]|nr:TIGR02450 family Trp-rich protein [Xanthomonadales bacterium]